MANMRKTSLLLLLIVGIALLGYYAGNPEKAGTPQAAAGKRPPSAQEPVFLASAASRQTSPTPVATPAPAAKESPLPFPSEQKDEKGYEIIAWPGGKPHHEDEPVEAYVTVGSSGRKLRMEVNQLGEYPRVQIKAGDKVDVRLQFNRSAPGSSIALTAQDGGHFSSSTPSLQAVLDESRQASFSFEASTNEGIHRVTFLSALGEVKTLDFWVGPLNVMRTTAGR